jgi:hypothetical protein
MTAVPRLILLPLAKFDKPGLRRRAPEPRSSDALYFMGPEPRCMADQKAAAVHVREPWWECGTSSKSIGLSFFTLMHDVVATNKPYGNNARKGAVRKRSQRKGKLNAETAWTKSSREPKQHDQRQRASDQDILRALNLRKVFAYNKLSSART